jgi:poly(ADP-ribose) glycohydrolase ARH3
MIRSLGEEISLSEKFKGVLLGTAVGDILGVPIEGETRSYIQLKHGEIRDFLKNFIGEGCYSDDTQMTLALATSLIQCGKLDPKQCASQYALFFEPLRSYGGGGGRRSRNYFKSSTNSFLLVG